MTDVFKCRETYEWRTIIFYPPISKCFTNGFWLRRLVVTNRIGTCNLNLDFVFIVQLPYAKGRLINRQHQKRSIIDFIIVIIIKNGNNARDMDFNIKLAIIRNKIGNSIPVQ